jgi:hypothetical protein
VLEKILPKHDDENRPVCLKGARRCPPEDVGGVTGYEDFLEALFDPDPGVNYERFATWIDAGYQPEEFDVKAVNEILSRMRWPVRHRRQ